MQFKNAAFRSKKRLPPELLQLRSLPPNKRAEALIGMHEVATAQLRFVMSEWAIMVLEHVKVVRPKKTLKKVGVDRVRP